MDWIKKRLLLKMPPFLLLGYPDVNNLGYPEISHFIPSQGLHQHLFDFRILFNIVVQRTTQLQKRVLEINTRFVVM